MAESAETMKRGGISVLAAVCLAALVLPLSFSGGAVATPAIGRQLGGDAAALNWITNAFMLSFGSLLMAAGALADQFGRKRIFILGTAAFAVVSLLSSLAPSVLVLDLLRAAQGIAAAAALSGGSAALAQEFEDPARTRAFSVLGTTFGAGLAFGPLLAGLLIEAFGWRSIFLSSAIVGVVALLFGQPRMRESRDSNATGLDWPGTSAFTGALSLFTFAVILAPTRGWSNPLILALLAGAAMLLGAFVVIELRSSHPMLDLSLLRYPRFVGVQILPIATCYCYVVLLVLLPLRFIGIEQRGEIGAGLLMLALSAPMLVVPFAAAVVARWLPAGTIAGVGLLIAGAGLLWLSRVPPADSGHAAIAPMLLTGFGAAMPWGLMDGLSVSVVPKERAGMATGIFSTTRVAGEGLALALVSAVLATLMQRSLAVVAPGTDGINEAAQRLATGDLGGASAVLPTVRPDLLVQSYAGAFVSLLYILAAITALSALATFVFLSDRRAASRRERTGDTLSSERQST